MKKTGADGITLALGGMLTDKRCADRLFKVKKRMISEGISLFLEGNLDTDAIYADVADGIILTYDASAKAECDAPKKEEARLREFANECDFARIFTDISPFAYRDGEPIEINEAKRIAERSHAEIEYDGERMLCRFKERGTRAKDSGEIVFPSLKKIKAKLDLIGELGLLGAAIDIMRCPVEHLMMISTEFISGSDHFPI